MPESRSCGTGSVSLFNPEPWLTVGSPELPRAFRSPQTLWNTNRVRARIRNKRYIAAKVFLERISGSQKSIVADKIVCDACVEVLILRIVTLAKPSPSTFHSWQATGLTWNGRACIPARVIPQKGSEPNLLREAPQRKQAENPSILSFHCPNHSTVITKPLCARGACSNYSGRWPLFLTLCDTSRQIIPEELGFDPTCSTHLTSQKVVEHLTLLKHHASSKRWKAHAQGSFNGKFTPC